ncbi:unnamed protein product [Acanthoscelides obtectus]|uniref:Uncharacterized protein n=1 Tax=Acanthoscelides obtectus TaxID=200917 RepID=A0A9P0PPT5_ACAOB|nr:unnamed protein product [Acanthoscelides obtectus]CAK1627416.1 hypothetical protein AOBTE_LOCUS4585 [Acanthoscelides obtectus]
MLLDPQQFPFFNTSSRGKLSLCLAVATADLVLPAAFSIPAANSAVGTQPAMTDHCSTSNKELGLFVAISESDDWGEFLEVLSDLAATSNVNEPEESRTMRLPFFLDKGVIRSW